MTTNPRMLLLIKTEHSLKDLRTCWAPYEKVLCHICKRIYSITVHAGILGPCLNFAQCVFDTTGLVPPCGCSACSVLATLQTSKCFLPALQKEKSVICTANQNGSQADCELGNPFKRDSEVRTFKNQKHSPCGHLKSVPVCAAVPQN